MIVRVVTSPTPFTTTLSNTTPLVFGMSPDDAAAALGTPLAYVEGPPGSEIFLTTRDIGGSFFTFRHDPLYRIQVRGLTSFGLDASGELYLASQFGWIYRLSSA